MDVGDGLYSEDNTTLQMRIGLGHDPWYNGGHSEPQSQPRLDSWARRKSPMADDNPVCWTELLPLPITRGLNVGCRQKQLLRTHVLGGQRIVAE